METMGIEASFQTSKKQAKLKANRDMTLTKLRQGRSYSLDEQRQYSYYPFLDGTTWTKHLKQ